MSSSTLAHLLPFPSKTGWPWNEESPQLPEVIPNGEVWSRVSIVTPSYNQAQFIEETIRSVLLQGYPNLEYIIIDGGSTDGTVEIIRKYEPWLTYWVSEKDAGQSDAINKGWRRSHGEIMAWLNSDDIYLPGALGKVAHAFGSADPAVGLIYGDCGQIDEYSRPRGHLDISNFELSGLILSRRFLPQPSTFIRRSVYAALGGLRAELHMAMDFEYWMRVLTNGFTAHYLPAMLASYRVTDETKSASFPARSWLEIAATLDAMPSSHLIAPYLPQARAEAYVAAGIELIRRNELGEGMTQLQVGLDVPEAPFDDIMQCIYWILNRVDREKGGQERNTDAGAILTTMATWVDSHRTSPIVCGSIFGARMVHAYQQGDVALARMAGLRAFKHSPEVRRSRPFLRLLAKALAGRRMLGYGHKLRHLAGLHHVETM